LKAIGSISASTDVNITDRIILEGAFDKLTTFLFDPDIIVKKTALWALSNLVVDSRYV